jgi:predicted permease
MTAMVRYSVRSLRQQPGLSIVAVVALGLGIGLTALMFSIIQGAFLRGLPFPEADRILALGTVRTGDSQVDQGTQQHDFDDWRRVQESFEIFGAYYAGTINVSDGRGPAERFDGAFLTASAFEAISATPFRGRLFRESDEVPGAAKVALLSHGLWTRRYLADEQIVGRTIRVNGQPTTVVGIMPEGFAFPTNATIWVPLTLSLEASRKGEATELLVFGRLASTATLDTANAEFASLSKRQAETYPTTNALRSSLVRPFISSFIGPDVTSTMYTMLGAVFGVMLIACANVANLLIARTSVRTREMAIRTAIGATRAHIVKQVLTDTLLLALAGTTLGLVIAQTGIVIFNRAIIDTDPPFWIDIRIDGLVLLFTVGLAMIATLAAGLLPALQASRMDVNEILKDESRGSSGAKVGRLSRALVIGEIAVSCGLLVASGLAIQSIINLRTTDFGFPAHEIFTTRMGLFDTTYPDAATKGRFYRDLRERVLAIPGVTGVTMATDLPATGAGGTTFALPGQTYTREEDYPSSARVSISPGFFDTFTRPIVRGRDFTDADTADSPRVVIINESFARKYFANTDPLGRTLTLGRTADAPVVTVVGIAPDVYLGDILQREPEGLYVPLAQEPARFVSLAVRGPADVMSLASPVRQAVAAVDPDLPIYWVRTLEAWVAEDNWHFSVFGGLFSVFGVAALFLATVGLYGVMSFSVSRRTQEIGVRMALGADRGRVLRLVLSQGAWQIGLGLVFGTALALGLSQLLTVMFFGVEPFDPLVFGVVITTLVVVAVLACLIPARRAMQVSPLTALRS